MKMILLDWLEDIADEADVPQDGDLVVYRMPGIDGE
jgi:hypothetical protein